MGKKKTVYQKDKEQVEALEAKAEKVVEEPTAEPEVTPEPVDDMPNKEDLEEIKELLKQNLIAESAPPVEEEEVEERPTRGHQQKIFEDKLVTPGGGTVRTQFTDVVIAGRRHRPATGTVRTGGNTTQTTEDNHTS